MSLTSKIIYKALKSSNVMDKTFKKLLSDPKRGNGAFSSKRINSKLSTREQSIEGFQLMTLQHSDSTKKHILFLHGGAYIAEANSGHRRFLEELVLRHKLKATYFDFPLAPEHQAVYTLKILEKAYYALQDAFPEDEIYLAGDSAGGGLALAFLQVLAGKKAGRIPQKTVLISPWLDISMSNPEIMDYVKKDVLLRFDSLKDCGRLYAGSLDLKDPLVSPIYGNLEKLGALKVFVSTHELFYPDCMLLQHKVASAKGTSMELTVKQEMIHDWVILPIKERDETIREMAEFLNGDNHGSA